MSRIAPSHPPSTPTSRSPRISTPASTASSGGSTPARPTTVTGQRTASVQDVLLTRFGEAAESAQKLGEDAARAETVLGIHGVYVTARTPKRPAPSALRFIVSQHFRVHNPRTDPLHRTIDLP